MTLAGMKNTSPTLAGAVTPVPSTRLSSFSWKPVATVPLPWSTTHVSIVIGWNSPEGVGCRRMLTL